MKFIVILFSENEYTVVVSNNYNLNLKRLQVNMSYAQRI